MADPVSKRRKNSIDGLEIRKGLEGLTAARITTLYRRAPLLRPVRNLKKVWEMYETSWLVLSAWHEEQLVGIARVVGDGVLFSYLCDLAVEPDVQGLGVGRALMEALAEHCQGTELVLRDSEMSATFYGHIGFQRVENAWAKKL